MQLPETGITRRLHKSTSTSNRRIDRFESRMGKSREKYIPYCPSHGVPTPMYFEGVLTDGGGANEFISVTSRGRSRN